MTNIEQSFLAAVLGVATHVLLFKRGEWHLQATTVFKSYLLIFMLLALLQIRRYTVGDSLVLVANLSLIYFASLFSSIIVYRSFFHQLRNFPGPWIAGTSKLWHLYQCLDSKNHLLCEELHLKYGDFVRTGPNELTVFDPNILHTIYDGTKNPFTKPAWYDNIRPYTGLNTHRSKIVHDHRRRIWDQAFTTKALQSYEPSIRMYARQLDDVIAEQTGRPIAVSQCFYWFSWDVMGHFAFSRSFGMLTSKKWHHAIHLLRSGLELVGPFSSVPWLTRVAFDFPILKTVRNFLDMEEWCARRMDERIERDSDQTDVSSHLIGWSKKHDRIAKDLHTLYGDSIAMIIAGSDTVSFSLVYVFYYLAKYPQHVEVLREELSGVDTEDFRALQGLSHLNGIINEVLRLHPAVPTGGIRETPAEGIEIAGRWIPGKIVIQAPRYTISRLESCYEQASEFVPERWYSKPHMVKNRKAFAPFALGKYYCIGKNLAYAEMYYVIAMLITKYDVAFAPGEDGKRVVNDMVDQFTAAPGQLNLVFTQRT